MSVADIIDILKEDLPPSVITDGEDVCKHILKSKIAIFLDTCFMSSLKVLDEKMMCDVIDRIIQNNNPSRIVLVITEMVLYESRDPRNNTVQEFAKLIMNIAEKKNVPVLILQEDTIYRQLMQFSTKKQEEWNHLFINRLDENKANLSKLMVVINTDSTLVLNCALKMNSEKENDKDLIYKAISQIKERKKDKDSMAEELICVVLFFLFEDFMSVPQKKVLFCSNDNQALARVRMAVITSYGMDVSNFENIHFFSLIQYMVKHGILKDREDVINILKKEMASTILVVEKKELPFCETEQMMILEDVVDGIFKGKTYSYMGNS